jgi:hypothetical protein
VQFSSALFGVMEGSAFFCAIALNMNGLDCRDPYCVCIWMKGVVFQHSAITV